MCVCTWHAESVLDGRDITSVILKDAMFGYISEYSSEAEESKEYKSLKRYKFKEVLKANADKSDKTGNIWT